jgi:hypothetical protein
VNETSIKSKIKLHFKRYVKYEELNKPQEHIKLDVDTCMEVLFALFCIKSNTRTFNEKKKKRQNNSYNMKI